jgi:hypothetical protein
VLATKDWSGFQVVLGRVLDEIDTLSDGMNSGLLNVDQWQQRMANVLIRGHIAAFQEGRNRNELDPQARRMLSGVVGDQVDYLNRFADQLDGRDWDDRRDRARAALYAGSLKQAYSRGETWGLELPFYPGDGSSECLGNCGCRWRVEWIDQTKGDADCYWQLGGAERHCTTCPTRAADNPYELRGGKLV